VLTPLYLLRLHNFHTFKLRSFLSLLRNAFFLGSLVGSHVLWGGSCDYNSFRKQEGMVSGDVKMMAMVGSFLGPSRSVPQNPSRNPLGSVNRPVVDLASVPGCCKLAVAERASQKRGLGSASRPFAWRSLSSYQLPLGTFLGIGALASDLLSPTLLSPRLLIPSSCTINSPAAPAP